MIYSNDIVDKTSVSEVKITIGRVDGQYASGFELNLCEGADVWDMQAVIESLGFVKQQIQDTYDNI